MMVTPLIPDLVIVDEKSKNFNIFELTVPFESNVELRHTDKSNKYAHYENDNTSYNVKVMAFEIGARGVITPENKTRLKKIHDFMNNNIKLKTFIQNIATLSIISSYSIYISRKQPTWDITGHIGPPN